MRETPYTKSELNKQLQNLGYWISGGWYEDYNGKDEEYKMDGKFIKASKNPQKLLDEIIDTAVNWEHLNIFERRSLAEDIISYKLAVLGLPEISFVVDPSVADYTGSFAPHKFTLKGSALTADDPSKLFLITYHELIHHDQSIDKHFSKKLDIESEVYNSNANLENIPKIATDDLLMFSLYTLSPCEQDANYNSLLEFEGLIYYISSKEPQEKYSKLMKDFHSTLMLNQEAFSNNTNLAYQELLNKPRKYAKLLKDIKDFDDWALENFEYILDSDYMLTHLQSQKYLPDFKNHKLWIKKLCDCKNPAVAHFVNHYTYDHTNEDVENVIQIFAERFGTTNVYPFACKYLSTLSENEIKDACYKVIGKDETKLQEKATKGVIRKQIIKYAHIFPKKEEIKIENNRLGHYLNYIFPIPFKLFENQFFNTYADEYQKQVIEKSNRRGTKPIVELFVNRLDLVNSSKVYDKNTLEEIQEFDYSMNN